MSRRRVSSGGGAASLSTRGGGRSRQGDGSPGSGARNSEARRDVPGPVGRRSFLKDKGGGHGLWPGQAGARGGQGRGGKQRGQAGESAAACRPHQGPGSRSRATAGHP